MTAINLPSLELSRGVTGRSTAMRARDAAVSDAASGRVLSLGLLLAALLIGAAVAINDGRLHWLGMQWLTIGLTAAIGAMILCRSPGVRAVRVRLIETVAAIGVIFQVIHLALCGVQMSAGSNVPTSAILSCTGAMAVGAALIWRTRRLAMGTVLLIGAFGVAAFACIWTHPAVTIDVLMFQTESGAALLSGEHPYAVRYRDVYWPASAEFYGPGVSRQGWLTYSFPYPPASLILVLPGVLLGDVRYAHAAAMVLSAALIAATGRNRLAALAAALLLTSPRTLLVLQTGWTESLLILMASATLFCSLRFKGATWLLLGLWVATKQYMVLLVPLLGLLGPAMGTRRAWRQTMLAAALVAVAVTLPFAATEPRGFFRGVIEWQFVQPFRFDALSIPAMVAELRPKLEPARLGSFVVPLVAALAALVLARWKSPRTPGGLMASAALVFACFFAFSKQAFCNYYLLVIGLCCCALAGLNAAPVDRSDCDDCAVNR